MIKLEKIPMPWDKDLTRVDKINMNESQITIALENLKELNVPRRSVIKFLIAEVRDTFKKENKNDNNRVQTS